MYGAVVHIKPRKRFGWDTPGEPTGVEPYILQHGLARCC
jgi:hypothetical protein